MKAKRLVSKFALVLLLLFVLMPSFFSTAYALEAEGTSKSLAVLNGVVTASGLNFRKEPSVESEILTVIPRGTSVSIIEEHEDWLLVVYNYQIGYVYKSHVGIILSTGIIDTRSLNIREFPNIQSRAVGKLYQNTRVTILEYIQTEDINHPVWLHISYLDGYTGYVSAKYVKILTKLDGSYRKVGIITKNPANVHTDSDSFSNVTQVLYTSTMITILDERIASDFQKWYLINYNGHIGWTRSENVKKLEWVLSHTTYTASPSSGSNRNFNMSLASKTLTGTIIYPGETFSWIKTMGSCSAEKGYLQAPVFNNGILVDGDGGGVCQVSTTINIAVKKLGFTTKANKHAQPVSYAIRENEASVSYPNKDFSFTNTLNTAILLELVSNNGTVVCNIYTAE